MTAKVTEIIEDVKEDIVEIEETVSESNTAEAAKGMISEVRENVQKVLSPMFDATKWVNDQAVEAAGSLRGNVEGQFKTLWDSAETITNKMTSTEGLEDSDPRVRLISTVESGIEDGRTRLNAGTEKILAVVDSRIAELIARANLPTQDSIDDLNKKIGALGRKIDKMRKEQAEANNA